MFILWYIVPPADEVENITLRLHIKGFLWLNRKQNPFILKFTHMNKCIDVIIVLYIYMIYLQGVILFPI